MERIKFVLLSMVQVRRLDSTVLVAACIIP